MSCLRIPLPKKLKQLPSCSKKAWKSFTSSIHPKLHHLHNRLEIPTTATAHRLLHLRPKRRPRMGRQQYYQYQHLHQCSSVPASPATVHVDRLFEEESSKTQSTGSAPMSAAERDNSGGRNEDRRRQYAVKTEERTRRGRVKVGSMESKNVRWKEYVSSLPTIRGVDERAEEFISKFRQEMQLQREESIPEFQQTLARSA